jgi:hypothetical protein
MRWIPVGPRGTWIREATKKAEVITATLGILSTFIFLMLAAIIPAEAA